MVEAYIVPFLANRWRCCLELACDDFLGRIPNKPSPASESGVLRVDGAAATPSVSPKGNDIGHGMGKVSFIGVSIGYGGHVRGACEGEHMVVVWEAVGK